jgi:hypothetical protein
MGQINFRVEDEEQARWRKAAEASGLSLSAWIRARCGPMSGNVVTVGEIAEVPISDSWENAGAPIAENLAEVAEAAREVGEPISFAVPHVPAGRVSKAQVLSAYCRSKRCSICASPTCPCRCHRK